MVKGMDHYYDQEKDRNRWKESVENRTRLIHTIKQKKIKFPKNPHEMKMKDLENLLSDSKG
jgi:hypothetical protein